MSNDITTQSTDRSAGVDAFLDAVLTGRPVTPGVFAEDARLDATVPNWRFSVTGGAAIATTFAAWFADPATFDELRREPRPGGEVVEFTLSWEERGVPHACHQVHLLDIDPAGRITADRAWCGGRWDAALLAQMGAVTDAG